MEKFFTISIVCYSFKFLDLAQHQKCRKNWNVFFWPGTTGLVTPGIGEIFSLVNELLSMSINKVQVKNSSSSHFYVLQKKLSKRDQKLSRLPNDDDSSVCDWVSVRVSINCTNFTTQAILQANSPRSSWYISDSCSVNKSWRLF